MTRWGRLCGALGAVALLAVAGCAVQVTGASMPDPVAMAPVTADAFGSAATVDPCSLVDVNRLPAGLDGRLEPADALDDCPVSVMLPDGTPTDVRVGPLEQQYEESDTTLEPVATLARGLTLYQATSHSGGFCDDYLTLTDGTVLSIVATAVDPTSTANPCPAADDLGRNAAAQIADGGIRHVAYASGSVGSTNPCKLVPAATLSRIGLTGVPDNEFPEMHECYWDPYSGNNISLTVEFIVGERPEVLDPTEDSSSQIAGRTTIDTRFAGDGSSLWCDVATGLNAYGTGTDDLVEIALIEMETGSAKSANPCALGNQVAAAVWPQLPKTG